MANLKSLKIGDVTYNLDAYNVDYASSTNYANSTGYAGEVPWTGISSKPINLKAYSGSLSSGGWATLNGKSDSPTIAIAYNNSAANWNSNTYSASMVWGCEDTRGLLDCNYYSPIVTFGGSNYAGSSNDNPNWYMKISGTNGATYDLNNVPYVQHAGSISGTTWII